jgi:hypothetical protein
LGHSIKKKIISEFKEYLTYKDTIKGSQEKIGDILTLVGRAGQIYDCHTSKHHPLPLPPKIRPFRIPPTPKPAYTKWKQLLLMVAWV